eukprot:1078782-Pyramimonas_sp.AAC.1
MAKLSQHRTPLFSDWRVDVIALTAAPTRARSAQSLRASCDGRECQSLGALRRGPPGPDGERRHG